jgi:hypothetical protein
MYAIPNAIAPALRTTDGGMRCVVCGVRVLRA